MAHTTLAVILGNRDFFPDRLVTEARKDILSLFDELDIEPVMLEETDTKLGSVETWSHAKRCADLFRANRDRIDGVLVALPNFGDEKGVADTLRLANLDVPVLIQAYPDDLHTVHPQTDSFKADLRKFVGVCRVRKGLRGLRVGAVGARPGNFNTMRYSEKLLEDAGITIVTVDFSEIFGHANRLADNDPRVGAKLAQITAYADAGAVPPPRLVLMAKLAIVLSEWMAEYDIKATALQCWTSIQRNYGIMAFTSVAGAMIMTSALDPVLFDKSPLWGIVLSPAGGLLAGRPTLGTNLLMDVVGATVIGGTSLMGGKGKAIWTVFGVLFFVLLGNTLNLLSLSFFTVTIVKGAVILFAALLDVTRVRLLARQ